MSGGAGLLRALSTGDWPLRAILAGPVLVGRKLTDADLLRIIRVPLSGG